MARCQHKSGNIQQFTDVCLDCGRNIWETDEEYEESLKKEIDGLRADLRRERISKLEDTRDALRDRLSEEKDDGYTRNEGGW